MGFLISEPVRKILGVADQLRGYFYGHCASLAASIRVFNSMHEIGK